MLLNSATFLSGTGMEQLPITDRAPVQRRGGFKAGQISSLMVFLLVPCSPIFQSLWPTNRLCSPPSGSCILYLHIAPSQAPPSVCAVCKPQAFPRSVRLRCFLPNELLFVLSRLAPLVTYHNCCPGSCGASHTRMTRSPPSEPLRLSRSNTISVSALPGSYPCLRRTIVSLFHISRLLRSTMVEVD